METDKVLDILEHRYSNFQIHGKVRAGVQYDSNANLGPDSNDLTLGIWRVQMDGAKAKKSFGAYLGADVDMGYRFYRDSPWWMVGGVQAFLRGHENSGMRKTRSRESLWGRAAAGLRHLTSTVLTEVHMKAEIYDYEFYQHVSAWGPDGTLVGGNPFPAFDRQGLPGEARIFPRLSARRPVRLGGSVRPRLFRGGQTRVAVRRPLSRSRREQTRLRLRRMGSYGPYAVQAALRF